MEKNVKYESIVLYFPLSIVRCEAKAEVVNSSPLYATLADKIEKENIQVAIVDHRGQLVGLFQDVAIAYAVRDVITRIQLQGNQYEGVMKIDEKI